MAVVLSCEVAGNDWPSRCEGTIDRSHVVLRTPDLIAGRVARGIAGGGDWPYVGYPHNLGLIDVTKQTRNRRLLAATMRPHRERLLRELYVPYHDRLAGELTRVIVNHGFVVHMTVSTFGLRTPAGNIRRGDVGFAHDITNADAVDFTLDLIDVMYEVAPMIKARRNFPRGDGVDSIVKSMRSRFGSGRYIGLQLMCNRAWARHDNPMTRRAIKLLAAAIDEVIR